MWNSMFAEVHNHSRIKSFLQSIYLKHSVHKLWIWQRIFPLQFRFDFIPGNCYENHAHLQQGSLFTLGFSFKTCDKHQIAHVHHDTGRAATHPALPPGTTRPAGCVPGSLRTGWLCRFFHLWTSRSRASYASATSAVTATGWQTYLKVMILALVDVILSLLQRPTLYSLPTQRQVLQISAGVSGPAQTCGPPSSRAMGFFLSLPYPETPSLQKDRLPVF